MTRAAQERRQIVRLLRAAGTPLSTPRIADHLDVPTSRAHARLRELERDGKVARRGKRLHKALGARAGMRVVCAALVLWGAV